MYRSIVIAFFCAASITLATAQTVPATQRIVVTFPAGGTADVLARLVADQMGRAGGGSVVVDNRPGANSIIGNEFAARAAPDGGTLLMVANSFLITSFLRDLPYDTMKSFEPVCSLAQSPLIIIVPANSPYKTVKEFIDATKAAPGKLAMGAIGPATAQRVAIELLSKSAGLAVNFVPYASSVQALNAVLAGDIPSAMVAIADAAAMAKDGRVRFLSVLTRERVPAWKDTPTMIESGYDTAYSAWFGLLAPAKTPPTTLKALSDIVTRAMAAPELAEKMKPLEFYPSASCGAAFGEFLRAESESTGRVVREAGIKME